MDRDSVRPIVLALLTVLAVGLAAATLTSPVRTNPGGQGGLGGDASPIGLHGSNPNFNVGLGGGNASGGLGGPVQGLCYPFLNDPRVILAIVAAFALGATYLYRRAGVFASIALVGALGIPTLFVHALLTSCTYSPQADSQGGVTGFGGNVTLPAGGLGGSGSGTLTRTAPSILLTVVLGVVLLAAVAMLFTSTSGEEPPEEPPVVESDAETDVVEIGRVAGAAADRIEDESDVANEVYRAWREMTDHLDVPNPAASTPAEFAAAAVDAGMAREDVTELTTLFEEVRYGGHRPTEEREARAVAALRRIEAEYATDEEDRS